MRIGIFGDFHGIEGVVKANNIARCNKLDAIIQVGDHWEYTEPRVVPTWMVTGNHEQWELINIPLNHPIVTPNLHIMPQWSVQEIGGIKFGFVGGIINGGYNAKNPATMGLPYYQQCLRQFKTDHPEVKPRFPFWVESGEFPEKIDVLITHDQLTESTHSPSPNILGEAAIRAKARYAFHGHIHWFRDYMMGDTHVFQLDPLDGYTSESYYGILDTTSMNLKIGYYSDLMSAFG